MPILLVLAGFVAGVLAVVLWRWWAGPQPSPEYLGHVEAVEQAEDHAMNLAQQVGQLKGKVDTMTKHRSEGGLDTLSLQVARAVEDQFTQHHPGGRGQRLAKVQLIVRESIREALAGEHKWDAWHPGAFTPAPTADENHKET